MEANGRKERRRETEGESKLHQAAVCDKQSNSKINKRKTGLVEARQCHDAIIMHPMLQAGTSNAQ